MDEFNVGERGEIRPNEAMNDELSIFFTGSRGWASNGHYYSNAQLNSLYSDEGRYINKNVYSEARRIRPKVRRDIPADNVFCFTGENLFARPINEFRKSCELYPRLVGLTFEFMASLQQITEEKTALLVKAGLWCVDMGVDNGSDRIKKEASIGTD